MSEEKKIVVEFTKSELFQIHLSLISRSAFATMKWASASNEEDSKQMQGEINFLTELTTKVLHYINEVK